MHNLCVVCKENERRHWDCMLGQTVVDATGRKRDIELTQWYASHEKVMGVDLGCGVGLTNVAN